MFNRKLYFNGSPFNRVFTNEGLLYGFAGIKTDADAIGFPVEVPLREAVTSLRLGTAPAFSVEIPLPEAGCGVRFALAGGLERLIDLMGGEGGLIFTTSGGTLRNDDFEEMEFLGLNLKPGSTLTIDTDTMEVIVDGEPRVDAWVGGGVFFPLTGGINTLRFYDDADERRLSVSVVWHDRYL